MRVRAKGKIRREEREMEENAVVPVKKAAQAVAEPRKSEVRSSEIVNIMADEIQELYRDYNAPDLDRANAEDKALIILRHLRYKAGVKFSEVAA